MLLQNGIIINLMWILKLKFIKQNYLSAISFLLLNIWTLVPFTYIKSASL